VFQSVVAIWSLAKQLQTISPFRAVKLGIKSAQVRPKLKLSLESVSILSKTNRQVLALKIQTTKGQLTYDILAQTSQ
jgi:hypothetical protein